MLLYFLGGGAGLSAAATLMIYNRLVRLKAKADEAFSGIEVQLKRRYDLIPQLQDALQMSAEHEKDLIREMNELTAAARTAQTMPGRARAEDAISKSLKQLMAIGAQRGNPGFLNFQEQLEDTENKLEMARRFYNATVRDYNTKCEQFPSGVVATLLGYKKREYFNADNSPQ